jgi:hypothetical protein
VKKWLKSIVGRLLPGNDGERWRFLLDTTTQKGKDVTGQTLFDDRPLRYRDAPSAADPSVVPDPLEDDGAFKIRLAKLAGARRDAGVLVERRYAGRGYQTPKAVVEPALRTFLAYDEGNIVGTVGVRLDSTRGLSADELYRTEIDALRQQGHRICEFTRLAVDTTIASKPVLCGLFHAAYLYAAVLRGFTHAVIEVNPRHVSYYRRALNFELLGPERMNQRVLAPAVLLCVRFDAIAHGVARFAGRPDVAGAKNSLFVYAFPPEEESGVLERLRELVEAGDPGRPVPVSRGSGWGERWRSRTR